MLLSQQRCADDSGIIAENRLADFSLLLGMLAVSFFFNIFSDRVKKVIALVADSAADAKYLGLENIDYIDIKDFYNIKKEETLSSLLILFLLAPYLAQVKRNLMRL